MSLLCLTGEEDGPLEAKVETSVAIPVGMRRLCRRFERWLGWGTHRPPACSRRAGGKRAFERLPRDRPKELTQILRSAGEHVPRRWVLGEPKPADGPVFWWANNGRKSSGCSPC